MSPRFANGQRVRVAERARSGHIRTPRYVRGRRGVVERYCGLFRNSEESAYGRYDGARVAVYRVRFAQSDLWDGYGGSPSDAVELEIFEHWLAPESAP